MKKLCLESLKVESFETADAALDRGTVHAHVVSNARCNSQISCLPDTCYWDTCMDCVPTVGGCTIDDTCPAGCQTGWTPTCGNFTCVACSLQLTCGPSCGATCTAPTC